jgi:ABC-type lipoprotein export system ATPase subunit
MSPKEFYQGEKEKFQAELKTVRNRIKTIAIVRFSVFFIAFFSVYYFLGDLKPMLFSGLLGIVVFSFLLKKHWRLNDLKKELEILISINNTELKVLNGEYFHLDSGEEFQDPKHFFSYDIDLFGRGSFFQFLNRTGTLAGKKMLTSVLTNNETSDVVGKQNVVKELSDKPKWRQDFETLARLIKAKVSPEFILNWIDNYTVFLPNAVRYLTYGFSFVSVVLILLISFKIIAFSYLTIWFFIGLGISGKYVKKINELSSIASSVKDTFQQYYKLITKIEKENFETALLSKSQQQLKADDVKASEVVRLFSKALDALDQRNNVMVAIVGNGLFLMDIKNASNIERWILKYREYVEGWFETVAYFDSQNSFANFSFNNPDYVFPQINSNKNVFEAKELGHPLINISKRVTSDCTIDKQQFFIITGANMAGKSTFLRTVSLTIVMANSGLPVCASEMEYSPVKLITSMRTSDSLTDESSYFFSELTRLKYIVDALKEEHYFIVLDEILKGTNSTDKAQGSQKFVEKLVKSNATGIIATHDLSLCEIEKEYEQIKNHYFDAEIINDELFFDYKLKDGVCQNMNASFLLKKMEIV